MSLHILDHCHWVRKEDMKKNSRMMVALNIWIYDTCCEHCQHVITHRVAGPLWAQCQPAKIFGITSLLELTKDHYSAGRGRRLQAFERHRPLNSVMPVVHRKPIFIFHEKYMYSASWLGASQYQWLFSREIASLWRIYKTYDEICNPFPCRIRMLLKIPQEKQPRPITRAKKRFISALRDENTKA